MICFLKNVFEPVQLSAKETISFRSYAKQVSRKQVSSLRLAPNKDTIIMQLQKKRSMSSVIAKNRASFASLLSDVCYDFEIKPSLRLMQSETFDPK